MLKRVTTFVFECDNSGCRMEVRVEVAHGPLHQPGYPKPPQGWRVVEKDIDGVIRGNPWYVCPTCQTLERIKAASAEEGAA